MRMTLDRAANIALLIAAFSVAWTTFSNAPGASRAPSTTLPVSEPVAVSDWRQLLRGGRWIGDSTAPVVIVEFSDFECPFCARFHAVADSVLDEFDGTAARYYVHYPISGHRFAVPAARVAECAADQGRFREVHSELFRSQDSLGLKSWESIADAAGIPDLKAFMRCNAATDEPTEVTWGRRLGDSIGVSATPTVIINGMRYAIPPYGNLRSEVKRLAATVSVDG